MSGAAYAASKPLLDEWGVKPDSTKKVGYGVQHMFHLADEVQARQMTDLLAEAACAAADVGDMPGSEAIYRDMERHPEFA